MAWIFQGNPKLFDIDEYLAQYPVLIYWRAPRYQRDIAVGDRAFIWRAGAEAGVIASGTVAETCTKSSQVKHPEALGADLWADETPGTDEPKVGIALDSVRLSPAEGMVPRSIVKPDPLLQTSTIITMANATVFRLNDAEHRRLEELWGHVYDPETGSSEITATEGGQRLAVHKRRERSSWIRRKKLEAFRRRHGTLHCEICGLDESQPYPADLAARIFEVHHVVPISETEEPRPTTLSDLSVLCANCHRAIHATADIDGNTKILKKCF